MNRTTHAGSTHPSIAAAARAGRTSAVAGQAQRDLQRCAEQSPDLFPGRPFDAALFGTLSAANAFSADDLPASALTMLNRGALWGFAVDYQVDYLARDVAQVDDLVARCLTCAETGQASDPLTGFLVELRDRLLAAPAGHGPHGPALVRAWREELAAMLASMRREWDWRATKHRPTLAEYLDNADNLGSAFVNLGHWIVTTDDAAPEHLDGVRAALRAEQKVIRLLNDLGTYERDLAFGDLNALLLGVDRDAVTARVAELIAATEQALTPLEPTQPQLVGFLRRQIGFCSGFYGVGDYWGQW